MKKSILFAVLAVFLFTACGGSQPAQVTPPAGDAVPQTGAETAAPTSAPASTATTAPTDAPTAIVEPTEAPTEAAAAPGLVSDDPKEAIAMAMRKLTEQKSFRVEQTINSPTDGTMVMNIDIIPPTRYRMTSEGFGLIIIDGDTYMQASEDQWVQTGSMGESMVSLFTWINSDEEAEEFFNQVTGVEFVGEETLDGETVRHYQYDLDDSTDNTHLRNHLFVGPDGLPRKLEVLISATTVGESDQGTVTNVYKDFGSDDIVIEAPQ